MMILEPKKRGAMQTPKQLAIIRALLKRNPDGSLLDVQELLAAVAPGTSRGGMIMSLRHLHMHGFIAEGPKLTRRGRCVRTYQATKRGADLVRPAQLPSGGSP